MDYSEFILAVNAGSIFILLIFALQLLVATKFRGENAYAAAIIVFTTIPTYLFNICRSEQWFSAAVWLAPLGCSTNTLLMPLLWLFVRRNFSSDFKVKPISLLHFLPTVFMIGMYVVYYLESSYSDVVAGLIYQNAGHDDMISIVNSIIVFIQMFVYFAIIFVYLHRVEKYITNNYSQAEWAYKVWIPKFIKLFAILFAVVFVVYIIRPRTDDWLIQIINVIAMSYLVHKSLVSAPFYIAPANKMTPDRIRFSQSDYVTAASNDKSEESRLLGYAEGIKKYLADSQAYLNPNLTLQDVSQATGISGNNISKAINTVLNNNFFELVNNMRIDKAKRMLINYKQNNLTIDAIAEQCGFNSRFTFNTAFKKSERVTPAQWAKNPHK
ncbi:MAG: helix-turn-helix transcriptional regulator [Bacteroidales bacterium]|nr:helix-turn-helix transcriptional regulator [Bacteroidales bacterium]MDD4669595.1 helix-turn-helix transcriptional regulator [Bacteroidales bacterium]